MFVILTFKKLVEEIHFRYATPKNCQLHSLPDSQGISKNIICNVHRIRQI